MTIKNISIIASACLLLACACGNKTTQNTTGTTPVQQYQQVSPNFNADSAYTYVKDQVDFGYRVPNTAAHAACGNYLAAQLKRFGAEVQEQKMVVTAYDGTKLNARNIIGSYAPEKRTRILLFAHWDTRPYSDQDTDPANHRKPLLGANDGASGVGVLLEVARILQTKAPEVGIDIIFFDAEDYGVPKFVTDYKGDSNETWCLGSRYWAKNPHVKDYRARYGILLDMVGAPNAKFDQEYHSLQYAKDVVERVWSTGRKLGYGDYFIAKKQSGVYDDHIPVNEFRRAPSIDIIQYDETTDHGFGSYWHTQKDDMSNIDRETLKVVGQTVLEVIYKEK